MDPGSSSQFAALYDSLPPGAQRKLVEKYLIPLLDSAPQAKSKKAVDAAARVCKRQSRIPVLDIRAKRNELNNLLDELQKDAKRGWMIPGSQTDEHLVEIINSIVDWLNDIWSVAYEYHTDFELCHDCLRVASSTIDRLTTVRFECKCTMNNMFIPIVLKNKTGRKVKTFNVTGIGAIDAVLGYIWRDVFLSILAYGTAREVNQIPDMLKDIEHIAGWQAVDRVFYGGMKDDDGSVDTDSEDEEFENHNDDNESSSTDSGDDGDDNTGDYESIDSDDDPDEASYALYWTEEVRAQCLRLRQLIESALVSYFESFPSYELFSAIIHISVNLGETEKRIWAMLASISSASSDSCAAALEIYAQEGKAQEALQLMDTQSHLLRLRDTSAVQLATRVITKINVSRALDILEKEMMTTARAVHRSLLPIYSGLNNPRHQAELSNILKLGSSMRPQRQQRLERWVDAISSPSNNGAPNIPMAFAMMMGVPDMDLEEGPTAYLDHVDPEDPDFKDLREEHRPRLKQIFESWVITGMSLTSGPPMLLKIYQNVIQIMPFLRAQDVTEEMINRMQDRGSKQYVCEGLDALLAFSKVQKRKWIAAKDEIRKLKGKEKASSSSSSKVAGPSTPKAAPISPNPSTTTPLATSFFTNTQARPIFMMSGPSVTFPADDDDDDETPPPLIPDINSSIPAYGPEPPPPPPSLNPFQAASNLINSILNLPNPNELMPSGSETHEPHVDDVD